MAEKKSSSSRDFSRDLMMDFLLRAGVREFLKREQQQHPEKFSFLEMDDIEILNSLKTKSNDQESNSNPSKRVKKDKKNKRKVCEENEEGDEGVELAREFKEKIKELNGSEVKFLLQKNLTASDVDKYKARMSVPLSKITKNFLTENEKNLLDEREGKNNKCVGINVLMLDPSLQECEICFKKWPSERGFSYYLTRTWNDTVINNNLKEEKDIVVQLWSFRVDSNLCFALVKL